MTINVVIEVKMEMIGYWMTKKENINPIDVWSPICSIQSSNNLGQMILNDLL